MIQNNQQDNMCDLYTEVTLQKIIGKRYSPSKKQILYLGEIQHNGTQGFIQLEHEQYKHLIQENQRSNNVEFAEYDLSSLIFLKLLRHKALKELETIVPEQIVENSLNNNQQQSDNSQKENSIKQILSQQIIQEQLNKSSNEGTSNDNNDDKIIDEELDLFLDQDFRNEENTNRNYENLDNKSSQQLQSNNTGINELKIASSYQQDEQIVDEHSKIQEKEIENQSQQIIQDNNQINTLEKENDKKNNQPSNSVSLNFNEENDKNQNKTIEQEIPTNQDLGNKNNFFENQQFQQNKQIEKDKNDQKEIIKLTEQNQNTQNQQIQEGYNLDQIQEYQQICRNILETQQIQKTTTNENPGEKQGQKLSVNENQSEQIQSQQSESVNKIIDQDILQKNEDSQKLVINKNINGSNSKQIEQLNESKIEDESSYESQINIINVSKLNNSQSCLEQIFQQSFRRSEDLSNFKLFQSEITNQDNISEVKIENDDQSQSDLNYIIQKKSQIQREQQFQFSSQSLIIQQSEENQNIQKNQDQRNDSNNNINSEQQIFCSPNNSHYKYQNSQPKQIQINSSQIIKAKDFIKQTQNVKQQLEKLNYQPNLNKQNKQQQQQQSQSNTLDQKYHQILNQKNIQQDRNNQKSHYISENNNLNQSCIITKHSKIFKAPEQITIPPSNIVEEEIDSDVEAKFLNQPQKITKQLGKMQYVVRDIQNKLKYGHFSKDKADIIIYHKLNTRESHKLEDFTQFNVTKFLYKVTWQKRPSGRIPLPSYFSYKELKQVAPRLLLEYLEKMAMLKI